MLNFRSSHHGSVIDESIIHEDTGSIPGLAQWVKDLALLWLWCRPEATALIQPLAWELLYASGTTLKRQKEKKKKANINHNEMVTFDLHQNINTKVW